MPAITTAGIYPGVSNLMAAHMVSVARWEYDERFAYRQPYVVGCTTIDQLWTKC